MNQAEWASLCARLVETKCTLDSLELAQLYPTPEDAKALCEAMRLNESVHHVVQSNGLRTLFSTQLIADILRVSRTVTILTLTYAHAFETGWCDILVHGLQANRTLKTLRLPGHFFMQEELEVLSNWLIDNRHLEVLDLSTCDLHDSMASIIANGLAQNSYLTGLFLSDNQIYEGGAIALADAIEARTDLFTLDLRGNSLLRIARRRLARAAEKNYRLILCFSSQDADVLRSLRIAAVKRSLVSQQMEDVLLALLGLRKRRRAASGMWVDQPREILKMVAEYAWKLRYREEGGGNTKARIKCE